MSRPVLISQPGMARAAWPGQRYRAGEAPLITPVGDQVAGHRQSQR